MAPNNGMRKVKQYKISSKNKRINALLKTKNPKLFLCSRNEGNHKKKTIRFCNNLFIYKEQITVP